MQIRLAIPQKRLLSNSAKLDLYLTHINLNVCDKFILNLCQKNKNVNDLNCIWQKIYEQKWSKKKKNPSNSFFNTISFITTSRLFICPKKKSESIGSDFNTKWFSNPEIRNFVFEGKTQNFKKFEENP